jgi:hypothetical protein
MNWHVHVIAGNTSILQNNRNCSSVNNVQIASEGLVTFSLLTFHCYLYWSTFIVPLMEGPMARTAEDGGWQRNGSTLCIWSLFSAGLSKQYAWERVAVVQCVGCEGQCVSFGITIWIISSSYRKWEGITVMTHPLPSDISFCLLRPLVSRQWRSATVHWRSVTSNIAYIMFLG